MVHRVRLFIDFWNFQLTWNSHMPPHRQCDWPRLPKHFIAQAQASIALAGITERLSLEETRVYASYNPDRAEDAGLRDWLSNFT